MTFSFTAIAVGIVVVKNAIVFVVYCMGKRTGSGGRFVYSDYFSIKL